MLKYALVTLILVGACKSKDNNVVEANESNLTPGMVKLKIVKNQTSQAEILETFGPPDMVTHRDGLQIWTYDKIRYDVATRKGGLFIGGAVGGGSGGGVGGAFGSKKRTTSSSTSTMLILYFDDKDVCRDYRLQVTRF